MCRFPLDKFLSLCYILLVFVLAFFVQNLFVSMFVVTFVLGGKKRLKCILSGGG